LKFDITKIANVILFMLENKVTNLNDKKLCSLLFLAEYNHLQTYEDKIFGETFTKGKRAPEAETMGDIFHIIANNLDLEDEDERLYLITELLDFLDIEILEKEKFNELNFIKMEEDYDPSLFSKKELITLESLVEKYKNETPRKVANATFAKEKVREAALGEVII